MRRLLWLLPAALLAACAPQPPQPVRDPNLLPPQVLQYLPASADPRSVRRNSDGCYWYLYNGPLESTYIPVETPDGRFLCETTTA